MSLRYSSPNYTEDEATFETDKREQIDKNLPEIKLVTLREWLAIWLCLDRESTPELRDAFGLCSHFYDPESRRLRRAQITFNNCRPLNNQTVHQLADVDSMIGVVPRNMPLIPVPTLKTVKYYMMRSKSYTLTSDLHIGPVKVLMDDHTLEMHIHKVPNIRFLDLGDNGMFRLHFPLLGSTGNNMYLGDSQMAQLYDLAFHPAALQTLPEDLVREWPGTYEDEKFRSQSHKSKQKEYQNQQGESQDMRGGVAQQTGRDIHVEYIQDWLDCARAMIQETEKLRWARYFFLSYELRGVKNRECSVHPPPEVPPVTVLNEPTGDDEDVEIEVDQESPRVKAVEGILSHFNTTLFEPGMWFIDIATRITISPNPDDPSECTFADADMHSLLFQHYTGLAFESCEELVSGQGNHYQKDEVAHLNALAGGRLTIPRRLAGDTGITYAQIYTTDKSNTYNIALAQNAQRTSAIRMLESWDQELSTHINGLMSSFENSACNHGVALRIETRVEYESYPTCHLRIPDELLRRCVYVLDRDVFWHWKRCRLASMKSVMCQWMDARRTFTLNRLAVAGTLLIIMEYMMNALVNRPASGGTWDQVHDAACVKEMRGNELVPTRKLGALFLPKIHFEKNKQPRVSRQRVLDQAIILYLLGPQGQSLSSIMAFNKIVGVNLRKRPRDEDPCPWESGAQNSSAAPISNKQRLVTIRSTHDTANPLAGPDYAQDQDTYSSEEEDQAEQESASPFKNMLWDIISNYPIQIMNKAPNRSQARESWCRLGNDELAGVTHDFFTSMENLTRAFELYYLFPADLSKWDATVAHLFPLIQGSTGNLERRQGVSNLGVVVEFCTMQLALPESSRAQMVQDARRYVSAHWAWLPIGTGKNHLWSTGVSNVPKSAQQVGPLKGGPWMIRNPRLIRAGDH
ncbi:hypothetical protein RhiTH_006941 [Rhizoctonia solani]